MNVEEFKKLMENAGDEKQEEVSVEEKREKAMKDYLDDVTPISEYINKGFKDIEAKKLTKKDGNK